jgi:hypothetical protein
MIVLRCAAAVIAVGMVWCSIAGADEAAAPHQLAHFDIMPKPALLPDGTIACYFVEQRGPGLDKTPEHQQMLQRLSRDGGKTWTQLEPLLDLPAEEGGFGYFVVQVDQDGEVHFFLLCDANTGILRAREATDDRPAVEPIARQRLDVWHVRSSAQRTQWSTPRQIWKGRAGDPQSVTQLSNGRLLLPLSYFVNRSWRDRGEGLAAFTYMGQFDTSALYSDDGGKTWQQSSTVLRTATPNLSAYGAVEPVVVELKDGRVWMLLRTQLSRFWESFSDDEGTTWSPAQPTEILSSDSPAGFVRLKDGRLLLLWNNAQRYPYAQGARQVLHAAVSADEGKTWHGYREVMLDPHRDRPPPPGGDWGVSYPFPIVGPDGRVIYSMWVQSGDGRSLETFDPSWLDQTEHDDDFSGGLDAWSIFGTRGVELSHHPEDERTKVLALRRADVDWPSAAVWNFPSGPRGSLTMRVMRQRGFAGGELMLTDHFSTPFDLEDRFHSLFNIDLSDLPDGKWADLELKWDQAEAMCELIVDGQRKRQFPLQRRSPAGPSYLRIRCSADHVTDGALLISHVKATVVR